MEIYKLSDFEPKTDLNCGNSSNQLATKAKSGSNVRTKSRLNAQTESGLDTKTNCGLNAKTDTTLNIITAIKPAVKNTNRANVFIDQQFSFSLDLSQLVDFKLKVGQKVTTEELSKYQEASELGKLYQRALEWVLTRPRSVEETKDYLKRKIAERAKTNPERPKIATRNVDTIIARMLEKHYLDDVKFATYYVENRFVKKGISRRRLEMELLKKGVDKTVIEAVLRDGSRDEKAEIQKIIQRKRGRYDNQKLTQYLCRQGFSYDLVKSLVEEENDS